MQKFKYINASGGESEFCSEPPFIFWKADGLSITDMDRPRTIRLYGHIHANKKNEDSSETKESENINDLYRIRKRLNSVLNPKLGIGRLFYTNTSGEYFINATCDSITYQNKTGDILTIELRFSCIDPYFYSVKEYQQSLAYAEGGMEYPVKTPAFFGTLGYRVDFVNESDVPVPVHIVIEGGSDEPILRNIATGDFIKVNRKVPSEKTIVIDTDDGVSVVQIITPNGAKSDIIENAYGYLTLDSTLFKLVPGENALSFNSLDEKTKCSIKIKYREKYVGV